jgi:hypothetical protein
MTHGITSSRRRTLEAALGIGRRTLERWRGWWKEVFAASVLWTEVRIRFVARCSPESIPRWLLQHFAPLNRDRIVALLRFLAPVSI